MRENLLVCLITFLIIFANLGSINFYDELLDGSNFYEMNLNSFNKNFSVDHSYYYKLPFDQKIFNNMWGFNATANFKQTKNNRFQRKSRSTNIRWNFNHSREDVNDKSFNQNFYLDYQYAFDEAKPQGMSYSLSKLTRAFGYQLNSSITDRLSLFNDISLVYKTDRDNSIHRMVVYDKGFNNKSSINYYLDFSRSEFNFNVLYDFFNLDYNWHRSIGADFSSVIDLSDYVYGYHTFEKISYNSYISMQRFDKKLFNFYELSDNQRRNSYLFNNYLEFKLSNNINIDLFNNSLFRDNSMSVSSFRNFSEQDNESMLALKIPLKNFQIDLKANYRIIEKKFNEGLNSRDIINKGILTKITYSLTEKDSLVYINNSSLNQTFYKNPEALLDNDQISDNNSFMLYLNLRENIFFHNIFAFNRRNDIFINSMMSSNNKEKKSYNLIPGLIIDFSDNFRLEQKYHLRADYDKFQWQEKMNDRLYRMFSAEYRWEYFSQGNKSKKNLRNFYTCFLGYRYENNHTGEIYEDKYLIHAENKYHTLEWGLLKSMEDFSFRIAPKINWYYRTELSSLFEVSYEIKDKNHFRISVNPYWHDINEINWRINSSLSYHF